MKSLSFFLLIICFFLIRVGQISAQTVTVDSIIQTSPCAGSNIYIPYTVSGGYFNFGNIFTAQLSGPTGSFNNPTAIGSIPYWGSGLIVATIPSNATFGINYKVRIVASSPSYTSLEAPNDIIVTTIAQLATITVSPMDGTICNGDSALLSDITPAQNYLWSTGATTQSIYVSQTGEYTVTVTDMLGCKTTSDPETITVHECNTSVPTIFSSDYITIYPNPVSETITVEIEHLTDIRPHWFILYDMLGREVLNTEINQQKSTIQRGSLPAGIFLYKIVNKEGIIRSGKISIR